MFGGTIAFIRFLKFEFWGPKLTFVCAGPTSFGPIIECAIGIVDGSNGLYHVLLIIADGQVTRSVNTGVGKFSPQESSTIDAIVKARFLK